MGGRRGFARSVSLIEMIAVAVVLGVFALIVAPNVVGTIGGSKLAALGSTLSQLQSGSDHFYALTDAYPTYTGSTVQNQPAACPDAYEVSAKAVDASGTTFVAGYLHEAPETSAASAGLPSGAGQTVFYGITSTGQVFATQAAPDTGGNEWTAAGTPVYTPSNLAMPTTLGFLCAGTNPNTASVSENLALSGSNVTVSGTAPAGSTVTATSTDPVTASTTAGSDGTYSLTLDSAWTSGQPAQVTVTTASGGLGYGYVSGTGTPEVVTGSQGGLAARSVTPSAAVTLTAQDGSVKASGTDTLSGTLTVGGQPAGGATVSLAALAGTVPATVTTNASGAFTATYTAPATRPSGGTDTVTAAYGSAKATVSLTVVTATISLSASPSTVAPGTTSTISGTVTQGGNAVSGATVALSASGGTVAATATTDASGAFTAIYTAPTTAQTVTITATTEGASTTTQVQVDSASLTVTASPASVVAGQTITVAGTLSVGGSGVSGAVVAVQDTTSGATASPTTSSGGAYSATVTVAASPGTDTVTASYGGTTASTTVQVVAPPTVSDSLTAEANGHATLTVTLSGVPSNGWTLSYEDSTTGAVITTQSITSGQTTASDEFLATTAASGGTDAYAAVLTAPSGSTYKGNEVSLPAPTISSVTANVSANTLTVTGSNLPVLSDGASGSISAVIYGYDFRNFGLYGSAGWDDGSMAASSGEGVTVQSSSATSLTVEVGDTLSGQHSWDLYLYPGAVSVQQTPPGPNATVLMMAPSGTTIQMPYGTPGAPDDSAGGYTNGMEFSVSEATTVTKIAMALNTPGIPVTECLWSSTGTQLGCGSVASTTTGYNWVTIPSRNLVANSVYYVSVYSADSYEMDPSTTTSATSNGDTLTLDTGHFYTDANAFPAKNGLGDTYAIGIGS